jgi:protein-tyrosine-phosphatase
MKLAFVCPENTGRSQMAAAFARRMVDGEVIVVSGGTKPAARVTMVILQAMKEVGIDISREVPRLITDEELEGCDHVITLSRPTEDRAAYRSRGESRNWSLPDPRWKPLAQVRPIRDEIEGRVQKLLREIGAV